MREDDYKCMQCGRPACRGERIPPGEEAPALAHLQLFCAEKGHHAWAVDVRCPNCDKVPVYWIGWANVKGEMTAFPELFCCGRKWAPGAHWHNSFYDEVVI